jgi:hypothetical protein
VQRLSSRMTFYYKFVFTTLWSGAFAVGAVATFLSPRAGLVPRIVIPVAWVVGSAVMWWALARLKRVSFDGSTLVISNYVTEITVPVREISAVSQSLLVNTRPVKITFVSETPFGEAVTFIPPVSLWKVGEDPIVERLRTAAGLSTPPAAETRP